MKEHVWKAAVPWSTEIPGPVMEIQMGIIAIGPGLSGMRPWIDPRREPASAEVPTEAKRMWRWMWGRCCRWRWPPG